MAGRLAAVLAVASAMLFAPGMVALAAAADFDPAPGTYTVNTTANPATLTGPSTNIQGTDQNGVAVFSFGNVNIPSGVTINASGNLPFEIVASGSLSLAGTINGSGTSAVRGTTTTATAGGPGGGSGGATTGDAGGGAGGGGSNSNAENGAGGGGFGGAGAPGGVDSGTAGAGGDVYGNLNTALQGGSGGGGGGSTPGGAGGGAVELAGSSVTIASGGQVLMNGGVGDTGTGGASGGGSGGGIILNGNSVSVNGTLSVAGGDGGAGGCCGDGGGGGGGQIAYQAASLFVTGTTDIAGGASGAHSSDGFGHGDQSADASGGDGVVTQAGAPVASTAPASGLSQTGATLNGTVNPNGAKTSYHFEYGTTTAYGSQVPAADSVVGSDNTTHAVSQTITGLQPGTTYHYRVVATDGELVAQGADETFTTSHAPVPPPPAIKPASTSTVNSVKASGTKVLVSLSCTAGSGPCVDQLELIVSETVVGSKVTAVVARKHKKTRHLTVVVGKKTVTLSPGQTETVTVALNAKGKALLAKFGKLHVRLLVTQGSTKIRTGTVTFKARRKPKHKKHK